MSEWTEQIEKFYQDLLIIQYHNKTKAKQTISLLTDCSVCGDLFNELGFCFDIDSAIGNQLDIIGKILGANRSGLSDSDFRVLLKFKIILNNGKATIKDIDNAIYNAFGTSVIVNNNMNMSITYIVNSSLSSVVDVVVRNGHLPVPIGIGTTTIISVDDVENIFGFENKYRLGLAVGFSTKDEKRECVFLNKNNLVGV